MLSTHTLLMRRLQILFPKHDYKSGACFGTTYMAVHSILSGCDINHFNSRLQHIVAIPETELPTLFEQSKIAYREIVLSAKSEALKKFGFKPNHSDRLPDLDEMNTFEHTLSESEKDNVYKLKREIISKNINSLTPSYYQCLIEDEMEAFLYSLHTYHYSYNYFTNIYLQDAKPCFPLLSPSVLKKCNGIADLNMFTGIYTQRGLNAYFKSLRQFLDPNGNSNDCITHPLAIALHSADHTICFGYNPHKHTWVFFNINNPPLQAIATEDELSKLIIDSFSKNKITTFASHFIFPSDAEDIKDRIQKWQHSKIWKDLHKINRKKATMCDSKNYDWLYLSILHDEKNIKKLLHFGSNVNSTAGNTNVTKLYIASRKGNIDIVKTLLKHHADPNLATQKYSPLGVAIINNHWKVAGELLNANANPNATDEAGQNMLCLAIANGNLEIVALLLACNVDLNQTCTLPLSDWKNMVENFNLLDRFNNIIKNKKIDNQTVSLSPLEFCSLVSDASENHKKIANLITQELLRKVKNSPLPPICLNNNNSALFKTTNVNSVVTSVENTKSPMPTYS